MEKNLIMLSLTLALLVPSAKGQLSKGTIFLGGSLSTNVQSVDTQNTGVTHSETTNFSIQPKIGIFLSSKIAVGSGLGYSSSHNLIKYTSIPTNSTSSSSLFSIAPFLRYYIPISQSVFLALHSQISYGVGNNSTPTLDVTTGIFIDQKSSVVTASVSEQPVFIFFPSARWGIEAGLGALTYTYIHAKPKDAGGITQTNNTFGFNYGQLSLGVAYYFIR